MTTAKFTFEFDVAYTYSLDKLIKELMHLAKSSTTHFLIDPCGPGGGNTNVVVNTDFEPDLDRIKQFSKEGPPCECDAFALCGVHSDFCPAYDPDNDPTTAKKTLTKQFAEWPDEPDNHRNVDYAVDYAVNAGKNLELEFWVDSHYQIHIKCYINSIGRSHFFTVESSGDSGSEAVYCATRENALNSAVETYGAPRIDPEWRKFVDGLLATDEFIKSNYGR